MSMASGVCHVDLALVLPVSTPWFRMAPYLNTPTLYMALMVSTSYCETDLLHAYMLPTMSGASIHYAHEGRTFSAQNANSHRLGFSISASYNDLIGGSCTSCQVSQDKSAYWTPALYFQSSSGQFTLVDQVGGMLA
jgi:hypothetical protein